MVGVEVVDHIIEPFYNYYITFSVEVKSIIHPISKSSVTSTCFSPSAYFYEKMERTKVLIVTAYFRKYVVQTILGAVFWASAINCSGVFGLSKFGKSK
jgi:hypothetical protein